MIPSGARKHQRVEDDVFRGHPVFRGKQLVGAPRDLELPLARERLGLHGIFVNAPHNNRRAEAVCHRHNFLEFFLAIFEVDGIDDCFALAVGERLPHGHRIRGVDHDGRFNLANQLLVERRYIFLLVSLRALQAHIHDVGATFHLPAPDLRGFLPFFFCDEVLKQPRSDDIRAFTNQQWPRAFFRFDRLYARIHGAVRFRRPDARFLALYHLPNRSDVLFRRAAATSDDIQPTVTHELLELRRKRGRRFQVFAFLVRQAGVRVA